MSKKRVNFNAAYELLSLLEDAGDLGVTTSEASDAIGIKNVRARVHDLRNQGYTIYTNRRSNIFGDKYNVYRLGTPSERYMRNLDAGRTRLAVKSLYRKAA